MTCKRRESCDALVDFWLPLGRTFFCFTSVRRPNILQTLWPKTNLLKILWESVSSIELVKCHKATQAIDQHNHWRSRSAKTDHHPPTLVCESSGKWITKQPQSKHTSSYNRTNCLKGNFYFSSRAQHLILSVKTKLVNDINCIFDRCYFSSWNVLRKSFWGILKVIFDFKETKL